MMMSFGISVPLVNVGMQPVTCPFRVQICCLPALQMSAFHIQMQELNLSEKILVRDGKRAIRADLKTSQQPSDLLDDAPAEVFIFRHWPATLFLIYLRLRFTPYLAACHLI